MEISWDMVLLGSVCLLLAAKLTEPVSPNFGNMLRLVSTPERTYTKEDLTQLEFTVVHNL